jgi:hypothetical protein
LRDDFGTERVLSESEEKGHSKWRSVRGIFPQDRMKIWLSKTQKTIFSATEGVTRSMESSKASPIEEETRISQKLNFWLSATVDQQLMWIFESEMGMKYFEAYMKSIYSEESLYFWIDSERYRTITEEQALQLEYTRIVDLYLLDSSRYQVNLSHNSLDAVIKGVKNPQVSQEGVCLYAILCSSNSHFSIVYHRLNSRSSEFRDIFVDEIRLISSL